MRKMLRQTFAQDLQRLQDEMLALGSMVENAILESVKALRIGTPKGRGGSSQAIETSTRSVSPSKPTV